MPRFDGEVVDLLEILVGSTPPPLGLPGELMINSFVLCVMYGSIVSAVNAKPLSSSVSTKTHFAARVIDHVLVSHPIRNRDQDLIAGIDQRLSQIEDGVFATDCNDALRRR